MTRHLTLLFLCGSLTSCTVMYRPTLQHVPMFAKKGDLQATVAVKNVALSYAATSHFGILASGYYSNHNVFTFSDDKSGDYKAYQKYLSLAVAYYNVQPRGSFELFGGYGRGYTSLTFHSGRDPAGAKSDFNNFFIQPNYIIGSRASRSSFAFSCRLSIVDFFNLKDVNYAVTPESAGFFEPAFTYSRNVGPVSIKGQALISCALDNPSVERNYYSAYGSMLAFNMAVQLHIFDLFNRN
jgi:hypothetical protein